MYLVCVDATLLRQIDVDLQLGLRSTGTHQYPPTLPQSQFDQGLGPQPGWTELGAVPVVGHIRDLATPDRIGRIIGETGDGRLDGLPVHHGRVLRARPKTRLLPYVDEPVEHRPARGAFLGQ